MIFIDTGAWITLTDKSDQYHREAAQIYSQLKNKRKRFVTTDYIIDETVTRLRYDTNHQIVVKSLDLINISEKTGILRVTYVDERLFQKAISIFRQYESTILSFTDCVSFATCKMHKIHEAFAFDQHFTMIGISLSKE